MKKVLIIAAMMVVLVSGAVAQDDENWEIPGGGTNTPPVETWTKFVINRASIRINDIKATYSASGYFANESSTNVVTEVNDGTNSVFTTNLVTRITPVRVTMDPTVAGVFPSEPGSYSIYVRVTYPDCRPARWSRCRRTACLPLSTRTSFTGMRTGEQQGR